MQPYHLHNASNDCILTCSLQVIKLNEMKNRAKSQRLKCRSHCPVSFGLESMGDRWSLLIIRDIVFYGKRTYGELLKAEERIATNILASRLEFLEGIGVLTKSPHGEDARKDIYSLTEKGLDLIPILFEVVRWSAKHDPLSDARRQPGFLRQLRTKSEELNKKTRALVRAGECLFSKPVQP